MAYRPGRSWGALWTPQSGALKIFVQVHVLDLRVSASLWSSFLIFKMKDLISKDKYPKLEFLDCMVVLFLIFCGSSILCSTVEMKSKLVLSYQQCIRVPYAPHFLQHLLALPFLTIVWADTSLWFDLRFPDDWWCWASLHVSVGCQYVAFGKMSIQI